MLCPNCRTANPDDGAACVSCRMPLPGGTVTIDAGSTARWAATSPFGAATAGTIAAGVVIGGRYEILALLGEGGMGAVYKANDREVDRLVALKVVRPELAGRGDILRRFRDELVLARQVTHHNVIRIYDLGVADGLRFISMEYMEGEDLGSLIARRGKLPPEEAGAIFRQIVAGLGSAHAGGVVHRDLKPKNVMLDSTGRAAIMDFGIARSAEGSGMTHTGDLVGTPYYMSPEQARGEHVDSRSDLYSAGLIFYELLIGDIPFRSDSLVTTLLKRSQERPKSPHELDPAIPAVLSDLVMKCLEVRPENRYASAAEIVAALDAWLHPPPKRVPGWAVIAASAILVLGAMLYREVRSSRAPPPARAPVSVLVGDFDNATGEPILNGTIESAIMIALEEAPFLNLVNQDRARRAAAQVQPGATRLDEKAARLVAVREGIGMVVNGSVTRAGAGYRLSIKAVDGVTGKIIAEREVKVSGKQDVLGAVSKLAAPIRKAVGDRTPQSAQAAAAETFTATSLEAAHAYAGAQQLILAGKWEDAIRGFSRAVQLDPENGRAYAGMAVAWRNLRQRAEAEKYYGLALAHIDRMTDREKYRTRGGYYVTIGNQAKALEEFNALVKEYPADTAGHANLALAYFLQRNLSRALEEGRVAIAIYPNNVAQRNNVALYAMYAGDFETAVREAQAVLKTDPSFANAYVALALSELARGRIVEAAAAWERLGQLGARGASDSAAGLADLALYEGRQCDAAGIEKAISGDLASENKVAAANKLVMLAEISLLDGKPRAAVDAAARALSHSRQEKTELLAALIYAEAGETAKAEAVAAGMEAKLVPEPQAYARLIRGEIERKRGHPPEAVRLFQEAQKQADTWLGRFHLGRAYLDAGAFAEADSDFEVCLRRRGEAAAAFLDDVPTYRYLPPVHYYLGRAKEGLKSPGAADSYRTFLAIKEKGDGDPLVADARRRIGAR